jgi:hypothetical protein
VNELQPTVNRSVCLGVEHRTASARLYSMAGHCWSRDVYRARVRHFVYVILVTRHVVFTVRQLRARPPYCLRHVRHIVYVTLYCCLVAIAAVVHKRHIAYSMHVTIQILLKSIYFEF